MRLALLRSLHAAGLEVLQTACPWEKAARTGRFQRFWAREVSGWDAERLAAGMPPLAVGSAEPPAHPARTEHPVLMDERSMPSPRALGVKPAPYLVHALAHIELNAVDLYWDVMVRSVGDGLPLAFYDDILRVAADEATHFGLLRRCLHAHGLDYGSIPAHTGLWDTAQRAREDPLGRIVVTPLVHEARGLDAGPRLVEKLNSMADHESARVVQRIVDEEVDHVSTGVKWFLYLCDRECCEPVSTFQQLLRRYNLDPLYGPFNDAAREMAGMTKAWYEPMSAANR